jgi:hypothetical protein
VPSHAQPLLLLLLLHLVVVSLLHAPVHALLLWFVCVAAVGGAACELWHNGTVASRP